jgi:segregation and condensation protein A
MAATLALIKSRMLLPPDDEDEELEEVDPRAELVARLLEYQRYKEVAEQLGRLRLLGRDVFAARGAEPKGGAAAELGAEVGLFELLDAFRKVLEEASEREKVHELERETVTVRQCMIEVMEVLEGGESAEFGDLFRRQKDAPVSRVLVVATFLAVLELVRLSALSVYQALDETGSPSGPIRLRALTQDPRERGQPAWQDRISDVM